MDRKMMIVDKLCIVSKTARCPSEPLHCSTSCASSRDTLTFRCPPAARSGPNLVFRH